jgi:hypothetical protein
MRNFDTAAWTNWDLPVNFFLREIQPSNDNLELGNGSDRIICNIYACPGLQPEGIELKLGLEGDNTAFSVPAHGMFDDCLEVNLGLDPSVFIISNPVRVAQDVHCWMMLDFGEISEIVEEENSTIPVNFRVISSNETLGGDRPEFTFPNNLATQGTIQGISSFSRLSEDYNTAWILAGSFVISGKNPSSVIPTISMQFRSNTFFSSTNAGFSTSSNSATPNTNNTNSILVGTPTTVLSPTLTIDFWQLGSEQIGNFVSSYANTQNIDRTITFQPGVTIPFSLQSLYQTPLANTHTFRELDSYTSGTGSSGSGAPTSCTEEQASEGILWVGQNGLAPGRNRSNRREWSIEANGTRPTGFIVNGVETVINNQGSLSQSFVEERSVSILPRAWSVNTSCVGTGTISFVPRVRFNIELLDPASVSASYYYNDTRSQTWTGVVTVLPGRNVSLTSSYQQTSEVSIPAYNPINQGQVATTTISISTSTPLIDLDFYDEEATSCLFSETLIAQTTDYLRVDSSPVNPYNLSVDALTFVPSNLPFPSFPTLTPSTNVIGNLSGGGTRTGQRVISINNSEVLKGAISGQTDVLFGNLTPSLFVGFPAVDLLSTDVGDTITAPAVNFTTRRVINRSLTIPGSTSAEILTYTDTTASSQALGKRFIIQQSSGTESKYTILVCTATALGAVTSSSNTTETRSLTLRVDEIHRETFGTPIASSTNVQAFRFNDVSDLFFNSAISRRRLTIRRSTDPDVFWNIWASQPPRSVSSSVSVTTHTYSQGQLLKNGSINWDFTPVSRAYEGHSGSVNFIKVNP